MFGSVRKMVSAFETRKQPRTRPLPPASSSSTKNPFVTQQNPPPSPTPTPTLKALPCSSTTPETPPSHISGHARSTQLTWLSGVSERCCNEERPRQDVVLRGGRDGRIIPRVRLRDSWPMGNFNSIERNFLSVIPIESKGPIRCFRCPPEFDRSRLRPVHCNSASATGLTDASARGLNTDSFAPSTAASVTGGTYSCSTAEASCKLSIAGSANANANSDCQLLRSFGQQGPVLVGGASRIVCEPPRVHVYPKQLVLGNAPSVAQSWGRGQEKGTIQHQIGPRPSDSTFTSLLLLFHSGSSNSMIAIDNKIEQAMDLVKAHLMLAVREEVEVLREQIKELAERNAQLERENYILRGLRENQ